LATPRHPLDDQGTYTPTWFEVAVSMSPALAFELRNTLDRLIQQSQAQHAAAAARHHFPLRK